MTNDIIAKGSVGAWGLETGSYFLSWCWYRPDARLPTGLPQFEQKKASTETAAPQDLHRRVSLLALPSIISIPLRLKYKVSAFTLKSEVLN